MTKSMIRLAQNYLNDAGFNAGKADGIFGRKTERAIDRGLKKAGRKAPEGWEDWSASRWSPRASESTPARSMGTGGR